MRQGHHRPASAPSRRVAAIGRPTSAKQSRNVVAVHRPQSAAGTMFVPQPVQVKFMPPMPAQQEDALQNHQAPHGDTQGKFQSSHERGVRRLTWVDDGLEPPMRGELGRLSLTESQSRQVRNRHGTPTGRPTSATTDRSRVHLPRNQHRRRPVSATERHVAQTLHSPTASKTDLSPQQGGKRAQQGTWPEDNVNSRLRCKLCADEYEDPRFLACLHTFCCKCIHHLKNVDGKLVCPECEYVTTLSSNGIMDLPKDSQMQAALQDAIAQGAVSCGNCGKANSELHCMVCNTSLCQQCFDETHTAPMFRKHNVVSVDELIQEDDGCKIHSKALQYYCTACDQSMCESCFVCGAHNDHLQQCCTIEDAVAQIRSAWVSTAESLNLQRGRLTTALIETSAQVASVQKAQNEAHTQIQLKFEQLRQELNRREKDLLREVVEAAAKRKLASEQSVRETESLLGQLSCCLDAGERVVTSAVPSHLLHSKQCVFTQAQRLIDVRTSSQIDIGTIALVEDGNEQEELHGRIASAFRIGAAPTTES